MKINIQLFGKKARVIVGDKIEIQEYNYSWKKYVTNFTCKIVDKKQIHNEGSQDLFSWECYSAIFGELNIRLWLDASEWVKNGKLDNSEICFESRNEYLRFRISKIS